MTTPVLNDFHNYLRLEILLSTYGNFTVRKIFRSRYIDLTGNEWKDCSKAKKEFLAYIQSALKKAQKIQKESIQKGDINEWDLGTTFLVLRTMCSYKNGYVAQRDSDTDATKTNTENNLIAQLIEVRNSITHSPGKSICLSDFKLWWKSAAAALLALGVPSEDVEYVRTCKDIPGIEFKNSNEEAMNAENVEKAKKLGQDGKLAAKSNKFDIAIEAYTRALRLYGLPKIERAMLCSNRSFVYLKSLTEVRDTPIPEDEVDLICNLAMEDAERAIELRPTWFRGYFRQAKVHEFKKEWEPAIMSFDQALGLNMGDEEILKARDVCRMELTRAQCRDYLNPTEILNRTNTQEFIDKMCSDRGLPRFRAKKMCCEKLLKSKDPRKKSKALIFLAHRYTHGIDDYPQDYEKAIKLLKEAEDLGDPEAMFMLGCMYQVGFGVQIDFDVAVKQYEKSIQGWSEKNYTDMPQVDGMGDQLVVGKAQYLLGRCYHEGLGKPVDYSKAAKLYSLASENTSGDAAYSLGWLYCKGHGGVIQNKERATQYWKLAAKRGVASSLQHLAWTNLSRNNLDSARLHFSFALKADPILNSLEKKKFYNTLNSLRKWKSAKNETASSNDHPNQGKNPLVQPKGSTKLNDDSAASSKLRAFDDEFHSYGVIDTELIQKTKYLNAIGEMEEKAALGLPYAAKVLTSFQNLQGGQARLNFLKSITKDSHPHFDFDSNANACFISNKKTELLCYLADHFRTLRLAKPLSDDFSATLKEIATETMKLWNNKESEIDCNARICYSSIISNSSQETVHFLTVCQRKYPQEFFFPILHSTILGDQLENKEEEALDVVIKALNKFPGDVELLGLKAKLLYTRFLRTRAKSRKHGYTRLAIKEIVTAYKDFVNVAPPDHRRVPISYYVIGFLCHEDSIVDPISNTEYLRKLEKYFGLGWEAEKNLLSIFLPPEGNVKDILQTLICKLRSEILSEGLADLSVSTRNSTSNAKPTATESHLEAVVSGASYIQLTDPNRIDSVLRHRNAVKMFQNMSGNTRKESQQRGQLKSERKKKKPYWFSFTSQSLNTQKIPSNLAGLKEIQLEEMDPFTDRVYTGRVLQNATIIVDSLFEMFSSIMSVVMDSNGEFQRCAFMNLDHNDEKVRKCLSFGSKLSIINPYYRLPMQGGCVIRIEDPQSVVFHSAGDDEPLCRFCLAKNPQRNCSKCKRAKYCSRQCQIHDWKILHHKLTCKP